MIPDHTVTVSDGVQSIRYDVIAHVDEDDYSWRASAVLRRPSDGALFYHEDCGCSCNYFGECVTTADLTPIFSMDEAYRLAGSDRDDLRRSFETGEVRYR